MMVLSFNLVFKCYLLLLKKCDVLVYFPDFVIVLFVVVHKGDGLVF